MRRIGDNLDVIPRSAAFALLMAAVVVWLAGAAAVPDGRSGLIPSAPAAVLMFVAGALGATMLRDVSRPLVRVALARTRYIRRRSTGLEQSDPRSLSSRRVSAADRAGSGLARFYRGVTEQPYG